jgi:DNA recombination protein RmuC
LDLILAFLFGLLIGVVPLALILRAQRSKQTASADQVQAAETRAAGLEATLEAERSNFGERIQAFEKQAQVFEEQRKANQLQLLELGDKLGEKFRLHADSALQKQEQDFLERAAERLKPLDLSIEKLRKRAEELEATRKLDQGSLSKQLEQLNTATRALHSQSESLTTALRGSSKSRGRWGETTLHNLVELAGMAEYCDFTEQSTSSDGLRPDLVVRLPGGEQLPVDSKVPLTAFMDATQANDPERRDELLKQHCQDLFQHVKTLGSKSYANSLSGSFDFTVMFLPGDHFLEAAFRFRPQLQEEALAKQVLIATPVTLLALLKTVQLVWRNERVAEDAKLILQAATEIHGRISTFSQHLDKLGKSIGRSAGLFNKARSSFESRVLPAGRKIETLTITSQEAQQMQAPDLVDGKGLDLAVSEPEVPRETLTEQEFERP